MNYVWLDRWDYTKQTYIPYKIPDNWITTLYTNDMDKEINCMGCGRIIKYGNSFCSLEIHGNGFGFPVCQRCYKEELERREQNKN